MKMPLWDHGKSFTIENTQTVQIPLNIIPCYSYEKNRSDSVYHRIIANTVTFLVMQRERGEKDVTSQVVKFIAEDDYLMDNPSKIFRFSLSSLSDYCGKILYYDIHGDLLCGDVYENGVRKTDIRLDVGRDNATRSYFSGGRYYECLFIEGVAMSRGVGDEQLHIDTVFVYAPGKFWPCLYTKDNGPGGNNGGGDGGGSNPPVITTTKVSKPLPKMIKQIGKTCVTNSMAFINKYFGGNKKVKNFNKEYNKKYNADVQNGGIKSKEYLKDFINSNFNTTSFTTYESAFSKDYLVMVAIMTDLTITIDNENKIAAINTSLHFMVATGCSSDGTLTTMDPGTGLQRTINQSEVLPEYITVITGIK